MTTLVFSNTDANLNNLNHILAYAEYLILKERLNVFEIENIGLLITQRSDEILQNKISNFFNDSSGRFKVNTLENLSKDILIKQNGSSKGEIIDIGIYNKINLEIRIKDYDDEINRIITSLETLICPFLSKGKLIFYWDADNIFKILNEYLKSQKRLKIQKLNYELNGMAISMEEPNCEIKALSKIKWVQNTDVRYWLDLSNVRVFSHKFLFPNIWSYEAKKDSSYKITVKCRDLTSSEISSKQFENNKQQSIFFIEDLIAKLQSLESHIESKFQIKVEISEVVIDFYNHLQKNYSHNEIFFNSFLKELKISHAHYLNSLLTQLEALILSLDVENQQEIKDSLITIIEDLKSKMQIIFSKETIKAGALEAIKLGLTTFHSMVNRWLSK